MTVLGELMKDPAARVDGDTIVHLNRLLYTL